VKDVAAVLIWQQQQLATTEAKANNGWREETAKQQLLTLI